MRWLTNALPREVEALQAQYNEGRAKPLTFTIGPPQETLRYTVEDLTAKGLIGLYAD